MPTCFLPHRLSSSYPSLSWLLPCLPWSPRKQLWTMCAACPRAGACTVACRVRVQFSGNELLKMGSWAHDITTSLSLTAKTNSGNCFGLCWISMPPWLLLIHWEGDACCWSVRLKKAGGGLARGAAKLESSRLGKAWGNVAKGEWLLTAQLSSGNHQQPPVRGCEGLWFAKVFHLGLPVKWSNESGWEEREIMRTSEEEGVCHARVWLKPHPSWEAKNSSTINKCHEGCQHRVNNHFMYRHFIISAWLHVGPHSFPWALPERLS